MAELTCGDLRIALEPGESVLRALERSGVIVPSSCRVGACQSCLVRVTRGEVPARAQLGLKESLCVRGFALACQAVPTGDLEVEVGAARALELPARVTRVERLGPDILRVRLTVSGELGYRAGQFITLLRPDGLARPYSLASRPADGAELELHVRLLPGGQMSEWLASEDAKGAAVAVRGPVGDCFYLEGQPEQPLVLAGVGSGLAPLWGIVRDALASGHRGPIELWHGARTAEGLYLREELRSLQSVHENFVYRPCALESSADGVLTGRLDQLLLAATTSFAAPRFYLCGDAPFVQGLKRALFLRGASLRNIFADAFVGALPPNSG
jgi:CDP-4-dehydro-6-deoxyglucose reductase, E3